MRFVFFAALLAAMLCAIPEPAYAGYLDSGTGSTLVQGIIAIVAAFKRLVKKMFGLIRSDSGPCK